VKNPPPCASKGGLRGGGLRGCISGARTGEVYCEGGCDEGADFGGLVYEESEVPEDESLCRCTIDDAPS